MMANKGISFRDEDNILQESLPDFPLDQKPDYFLVRHSHHLIEQS